MNYDIKIDYESHQLHIISKRNIKPIDLFDVSLRIAHRIYKSIGNYDDSTIPSISRDGMRDSCIISRDEAGQVLANFLPDDSKKLIDLIDEKYPVTKYKALPMAGLVKTVMEEVSKEI